MRWRLGSFTYIVICTSCNTTSSWKLHIEIKKRFSFFIMTHSHLENRRAHTSLFSLTYYKTNKVKSFKFWFESKLIHLSLKFRSLIEQSLKHKKFLKVKTVKVVWSFLGHSFKFVHKSKTPKCLVCERIPTKQWVYRICYRWK